jgi:hypothetical protein
MDRTGFDIDLVFERAKQRGLAAAVAADHADMRAFRNRHGGVFEQELARDPE